MEKCIIVSVCAWNFKKEKVYVMSSNLSVQDREQIDAGIRDKYKKVAATPKGHFKYPTGRDGLKGLHYDHRLNADLPDTSVPRFCTSLPAMLYSLWQLLESDKPHVIDDAIGQKVAGSAYTGK